MGLAGLVNSRVTTVLAWSCAVMIAGMNIFLIG